MSGRIHVSRVDDGPLWAIGSTYFSRALVEHAKAVPGMRFEGAGKTWQGRADAVAAVVARLNTQDITVDHADDLPDPESWRTSRSPYLFSTKDLREYQVEGVRFLLARSKEGALLADGMRLGKSCQATIAARAFKQKTLVVCPSHVVGVWGRPPNAIEGPGEIAKWWPDAWRGDSSVVCLETVQPFKAQDLARKLSKKKTLDPKEIESQGTAREYLEARARLLASAQIIVCHYDILYAWVDVLKLWDFKTLILDECHIVSGYQSRRSDALKEVRARASYAIGLSGTPITNQTRNLHNVLDILCPGRFGWFFLPDKLDGTIRPSYARVYCNSFQKTVGSGPEQKTVWDHSGRSNLDEPDNEFAITKEETLHHRLRYLMLRRLKRDVDPQLPVTQRQIIDVTIPARQAISVSSKMLGSDKELRRCLDLAADGKLRSVVGLVGDHVAEEEKTICFCFRRLFAERVAEELKKKVTSKALIVFVHGGLSQEERARRMQALKVHRGPGVLAGTIDTIGTGIDLSFASVGVVAELTYDAFELEQLEERLYKYGADSKSIIQYVIARGTGDELVLRGILNKMDTAERTIGSTHSGLKEDLSKKKEDGMKRLYQALVEMQKAPVTKVTRRVIQGER
jgi:SNF2 family DNA or RNA helicase